MQPTALILCAGRSRRMGTPKAFLHLGGRSLVEQVVASALASGCDPVIVVAGYDDDPALAGPTRIAHELSALTSRVHIVVGEPDGAPIDSIRAGLHVAPAGRPLLLWPVDHPFAGAELVRALVTALADREDAIVVPEVQGRRGHPVLFGARAALELSSTLADGGAHQVVHRDATRLVAVPASDPRLVCDLDTPSDAQNLGVTP